MEVRHLVITGVVQGVGYRYSMQVAARRLGVSGWVRNRRDGSVEALVAGDAEAVAAAIAWARRGPGSAEVEHVAVELAAIGQEDVGDFQQRPTT
ncbi:MAG: acylphosphatase [Rhodocyclaceae bacterium]|nr:acylphosphatase [Rhodocyclaceae bacterium]